MTTSYLYYPWTSKQGRLQSIARFGGGQSLQNLGHSYDVAGNLTGISDVVIGQMHTYTCDALDRLTGATVTGNAPGLFSESYSYDNFIVNWRTRAGWFTPTATPTTSTP